MISNPIFSIIVPAYQVEQYIEECIDSIIKQDFKSYEVIIIDDGSTDGTTKICNELGNKYDNVKVIHQNNQGLSAARNAGLYVANGHYVIFLDSDDFILDFALKNLIDCINIHDFPDVILCKWNMLKNGKVVNACDEDLFTESLYRNKSLENSPKTVL